MPTLQVFIAYWLRMDSRFRENEGRRARSTHPFHRHPVLDTGSRSLTFSLIPAKAGIQGWVSVWLLRCLARLRVVARNDEGSGLSLARLL